MATNVRVLVANRPRILRELVRSTLAGKEGIEIVGEAENEEDLPSQVAARKPNFLLITLDDSKRRPALCDQLLKDFPALRIIAVAPNTNVGIVFWASLEIHSTTMASRKEELLEVMRSGLGREKEVTV